jgi:hypothetical protein
MSQKYITPTLRAWMTRVGAVQISLKKFVVKTEDEGGYPIHGAKAIIAADGKFVADEALKPRGEEKAAIQAEVAAANFPKWIRATKGEARNFMDTLGDPNFVFPAATMCPRWPFCPADRTDCSLFTASRAVKGREHFSRPPRWSKLMDET